MTTLSAALAHCKIPEPEIFYTESAMVRRWKMSSSPRRKAYIPTDDECARLFAADMPVLLCRWIIIQTVTVGRPQTAVDLKPLQCNRDSGVVDLNPFHRTQNKKHRAKVKAGRVLRFFLKRWEKTGLGPFGDRYCGYETMEGVKSGVQRLAAETGKRLASGCWCL